MTNGKQQKQKEQDLKKLKNVANFAKGLLRAIGEIKFCLERPKN